MNATPQDIQVLALDVDGVLTDGTHSYDHSTNQELKSFHVHYGLGLSLWKNVGCEVVIISGRNAEVVTRRAIELGISHVYQGSTDKIEAFLRIRKIRLDGITINIHKVFLTLISVKSQLSCLKIHSLNCT